MIKLKTTQGVTFYISPEDLERVSQFKWYIVKCGYNWYIRRTVRLGDRFRVIYLHRFITDCPSNKQVHHINGDTLDNRRENLEVVTQKINLRYKYDHC